MQDTTLFETILGITEPWHVGRVELKTDDRRVDLWLEHDATRWPCPDSALCLCGCCQRGIVRAIREFFAASVISSVITLAKPENGSE